MILKSNTASAACEHSSMVSRVRYVKAGVLGVVGLSLLVFGLLAQRNSVRSTRAFELERDRVLAELDCDLSAPGEHVLPLRVNYRYGHGLKLLVTGPPRPQVEYEPAPWLAGLEGVAGLDRAPFTCETGIALLQHNNFASGPDGRGLARLAGSPPGDYQVRVVVTRGADGLAGVPHRLAVMNDVCGCELIGPKLLGLGGLIAAAIGVGLSVWSLIGFRRPRAGAS